MRKMAFFAVISAFFILSAEVVLAFNNHDFKGSYAFRLAGPSSIVLANESLTVATGIFLADGAGHLTGHGTFRSAGITCVATISGTYNIDTDGTGILASILNTTTPGCFNSVLDLSMVLFNKGNGAEVANNENDYMVGSLHRQFLK